MHVVLTRWLLVKLTTMLARVTRREKRLQGDVRIMPY
jgi:hypothetical protein